MHTKEELQKEIAVESKAIEENEKQTRKLAVDTGWRKKRLKLMKAQLQGIEEDDSSVSEMIDMSKRGMK
jgi:undecaprenyl pyrophosphate synthase